MATKGKQSKIGEERPTDETKMKIDALVDDVVGEAPAQPKQGLEKEEKGVEEAPAEDLNAETPEPDTEEVKEDPASEEPDEEVVPASKHKKTLDKMQKRIDQLTQKIRESEAESVSKAKTQEERLETLSAEELRELRDNVDDAMMDAKVSAKVDGTDSTAKLTELRTLKRNIDSTMQNAPKRFAKKQLTHLNAMVAEVKDIDPDVEFQKGDLWATAVRVFQKMPSLHRSETGQAEALAIATEYFLERKQMDSGRERTSTLSKKVADLKRKTTLDSKTRDANADQVSLKNIKSKAINGTLDEKLAFVKTLVPDDFLQQ